MMNCPQCGHNLDRPARFCPDCGYPLGGEQARQTAGDDPHANSGPHGSPYSGRAGQSYPPPNYGGPPPGYGHYPPPGPGYYPPPYGQGYYPPELYRNINKLAAGLLAILLGGIGVHKFYMGNMGWGLIYLLFCWTGIPAVAGLIEGIVYLTMSDYDFMERYARLM